MSTDDGTEVAAPRRGRPPVTGEQRRRQRLAISRHAVALFDAQGVAATSGEQVARAAGVSERTLWRLFRTKESCVEPLLAVTTEDFQATLRSWPADVELAEHLRAEYRFMPDASRADVDAALAVVRMARHEPALRAVRLLVQDRVEETFAEVLAEHAERAPDDPEVRVRAAAMNAALRVVTDDLAAAAGDGLAALDEAGDAVSGYRVRLADALRVVAPVPRVG